MQAATARTYLAFHHNAKLYTLKTIVKSIKLFSSLEVENKPLFKQGKDEDHVLVTEATIFHPQGGGQPSDTGTISTATSKFQVQHVRMDVVNDGQVLHFGHFVSDSPVFEEGDEVEQSIDVEKRLHYSRLHTAGHVLGAAVRHLLEKEIPGFDELKASHFPDAAACEFQGGIEGKWKDPIQKQVDAYIKADFPVEIDWWDEEDFRKEGLERLIPNREVMGMLPDEKFRVVKIVGAETYPCGGTHVDSTEICGKTTVKKISRNKGISRVSYNVN